MTEMLNHLRTTTETCGAFVRGVWGCTPPITLTPEGFATQLYTRHPSAVPHYSVCYRHMTRISFTCRHCCTTPLLHHHGSPDRLFQSHGYTSSQEESLPAQKNRNHHSSKALSKKKKKKKIIKKKKKKKKNGGYTHFCSSRVSRFLW